MIMTRELKSELFKKTRGPYWLRATYNPRQEMRRSTHMRCLSCLYTASEYSEKYCNPLHNQLPRCRE